MLIQYHTLAALTREWHDAWQGYTLTDAFSPSRDELSLAFEGPDEAVMLRLSVDPSLRFMFAASGYNRPRRNVTTLFDDALGRSLTGLSVAHRDRVVNLHLSGGLRIQVQLFGPRANVLLVDADTGHILDAFQQASPWIGKMAPASRAVPEVNTVEAFSGRWDDKRKTLEQALRRVYPLFDATLAAEVVHRTGRSTVKPADVTPDQYRAFFEAAGILEGQLAAPAPCIYWRGPVAEAFALVPLGHLEASGYTREDFDTVNHAVSVFARKQMAQRRFRAGFQPLEKGLMASARRLRAQANQMLEALTHESRADRYERWGHLLMASPNVKPTDKKRITVPNHFGEGEPVEIPLDPRLNVIENAQRYYEKARRTRQARIHAEARLEGIARHADEAERLLAALGQITTYDALERFKTSEAEWLKVFLRPEAVGEARLPFRRYTVAQGYEVWAGRSAKENDLLTLKHARKHDYWFHARGVGGSHVVLRRPNKQALPGKEVLEAAASIAAFHSQSKHSSLVPVQYAERKYVVKPKGAAPGAVRLLKEQVLLVEPRLPERSAENRRKKIVSKLDNDS